MTRARIARLAATATLVAGGIVAPLSAGCDSGDALVGGTCASGYTQCGSACCPVHADASSDATTKPDGDASVDAGDSSQLGDGYLADRNGYGQDGPDGSSPDGTTTDTGGGDGTTVTDGSGDAIDTGPLCTPPLVDCEGMCTDTTIDPLNCGQCGVVCPSQICLNSLCVGTTVGGIVYVGHDYLTTAPGTAQAHVLSNAVFIPQSNPLGVMSYERYASAAAVGRVKNIVNGVATQLGRQVVITSTSTDTDIPTKLMLQTFQVLIVQDQVTAPTGAMATLGASWAASLTTFTQAGGIVIVLDGASGTGEMPALSSATGLLSVTAHAPATGFFLDDVAPGDVVGIAVVSPYSAGKNSASITTEPSGVNVTYVIDEESDAGPGAPVVVHKVF